MKSAFSLRRILSALLIMATCSVMATSCASTGPKYGCPGGVNQGSGYGH